MKALKFIAGSCLLWIGLLSSAVLHGQQLKLGNAPAVLEKSALLELNSDKQGLWLPRVSDYTVTPLNTAPDGMLIYYVPEKCIYIRKNGNWQKVLDGANGVTSVGLSLPAAIFNITTATVTSSGVLTASLVNKPANTVFAGPATGADNTPAFRSLVAADIPSLDAVKLISGGNNKLLSTNGTGTVAWIDKSTFLGNTLNNGRIWVGDAANVAQPVALTGDVGVSNTGVTTIAANSITTTKLLNSNVTLAKLADGGPNQVLTTTAAGKPQWENKTDIVEGWALNGNTNATAANFLGTSNDVPFTIKTNGIEVIQFRTGVGAPGNVTALVNGASPFNSHPFTIRANGNDILAFEDAAGTPKWHWNILGGGLNFVESNVLPDGDFRLFLKSGGNVGIGTSNPVAKLDVNGSLSLPIRTVTGNGTVNVDVNDYTLVVANTGTITLALPNPNTCEGRIYNIKRFSNNTIRVSTGAGNIDGDNSPINLPNNAKRCFTFQSDGTNWYIISENY